MGITTRAALVLAATAALAGCSSSSSNQGSSTTVSTRPGSVDCTKVSAAMDEVNQIATGGTTSQATTAAQLELVTSLDEASAKAIDQLKEVSPELVRSWHEQTDAGLKALKASVDRGDSLADFAKALASTNSDAYRKTSSSIGAVMRAACPAVYATTTTTTTAPR